MSKFCYGFAKILHTNPILSFLGFVGILETLSQITSVTVEGNDLSTDEGWDAYWKAFNDAKFIRRLSLLRQLVSVFVRGLFTSLSCWFTTTIKSHPLISLIVISVILFLLLRWCAKKFLRRPTYSIKWRNPRNQHKKQNSNKRGNAPKGIRYPKEKSQFGKRRGSDESVDYSPLESEDDERNVDHYDNPLIEAQYGGFDVKPAPKEYVKVLNVQLKPEKKKIITKVRPQKSSKINRKVLAPTKTIVSTMQEKVKTQRKPMRVEDKHTNLTRVVSSLVVAVEKNEKVGSGSAIRYNDKDFICTAHHVAMTTPKWQFRNTKTDKVVDVQVNYEDCIEFMSDGTNTYDDLIFIPITSTVEGLSKLAIDYNAVTSMAPVMLASAFDVDNGQWCASISPGTVIFAEDGTIFHSCVSKPGWSGAPILRDGKLLGIHNGRTNDTGVFVGTHVSSAFGSLTKN
jgi:hypothetical protein